MRKMFRCCAALLTAILVGLFSTGVVYAQAESSGEISYRLGANDKLRIITFGEPSLTGEFTVSDGGKISMPLIGEVDAVGRGVSELKAAIEARLKDGYLKDPRVSIEVLSYRPFYILGEVNKPGTYPYAAGLTAVKAVAIAQGFSYRADTRKVYIKKAGAQQEEKVPLTGDLIIEPGDTLRVGERFF